MGDEKDKPLDRIMKLRSEIARQRERYHVKNDPEATDEVYDSLSKELSFLLLKYPEFDDPNAPEKRVAGEAPSKFLEGEEGRTLSMGKEEFKAPFREERRLLM